MEKLNEVRGVFKRILILLAVFSFAVNLLMLTMPLYMLQIYDRILTSQSMDTLIYLSVIAAAALIVLGLLEAVRAILASRAATKMETILGAEALRVGMKKSGLGEANIKPVRDLAAVRGFVSSRAIFAILDMPFSPIFIGIIYLIHPTLFWITLGGAVILFLLAVLNQWVTSKASAQAVNSQGSAMAVAQSISRNGETLQAMGMMQNGIRLWGSQNAEALIASDDVDSRNAILSGLSRTIRMGLQVAILGVGALLVLQGEMTAGMIFASSIISGRGLQPIDQVIGGWKQTVMAWRSWKDLQQTLTESDGQKKYTRLPAPKGHVSVEGALVLGPNGPASSPVINRVSFELKAGEVVGIVGPSGSGKSTLARLLVGAQKPHAGTIRFDGTEIQNWDPVQIGEHIGYLGQHVELLPGTIAQNIARLAAEPDDAKVLEAAEKAQVHQLIQSLPNGYDTRIGPGGTGLSGGQKQRIGLARAFYGNPQIMVLDEPNANLDEDGEAALHRALLVAKQSNVTIAIITQRSQALSVVDKVLRMHSGSKDFFGTRDEFVQALQSLRAAKAKSQGAPPNVPTPANSPDKQSATSRPANVPGGQAPKVPAKTANPYSFGTTTPMVVQGGKPSPKKGN